MRTLSRNAMFLAALMFLAGCIGPSYEKAQELVDKGEFKQAMEMLEQLRGNNQEYLTVGIPIRGKALAGLAKNECLEKSEEQMQKSIDAFDRPGAEKVFAKCGAMVPKLAVQMKPYFDDDLLKQENERKIQTANFRESRMEVLGSLRSAIDSRRYKDALRDAEKYALVNDPELQDLGIAAAKGISESAKAAAAANATATVADSAPPQESGGIACWALSRYTRAQGHGFFETAMIVQAAKQNRRCVP